MKSGFCFRAYLELCTSSLQSLCQSAPLHLDRSSPDILKKIARGETSVRVGALAKLVLVIRDGATRVP
jgi:hypothetical protein